MGEFQGHEQDNSQPPVLDAAAAQAIVEARSAIAARFETGGGYRDRVTGVTADGVFISVYQPVNDYPNKCVVTIGDVASMTLGVEPGESPLVGRGAALQTNGMNGRLRLRTDRGTIVVPDQELESRRRPTVDGKTIFSLNPDGYPWETAPAKAAAVQPEESEADGSDLGDRGSAIHVTSDQVGRGALRRFFRL